LTPLPLPRWWSIVTDTGPIGMDLQVYCQTPDRFGRPVLGYIVVALLVFFWQCGGVTITRSHVGSPAKPSQPGRPGWQAQSTPPGRQAGRSGQAGRRRAGKRGAAMGGCEG
jgi:hypothetical protein